MINRIYETIITNPGQPEKTYGEYINGRFTEEEKYSFEYLVKTIPEEMLEADVYNINNVEINEPLVKLLLMLAKFIGSSRDLILGMDSIRDIKYLLDKSVESLSKINISKAKMEDFDKVPMSKLATLTAYELGYTPDIANQEIVDTIKEVLLNRAAIEKLEVVKAHRGSLMAIKELIDNMYVINNLPISDSYIITEENLIINIQTTISPLLFRPGTFFYKALRSIKPAGVMLEFPLVGQNIFYDFSGISSISVEEENYINKVSITEPYSKIKPTDTRLAPEVEIEPLGDTSEFNVYVTNYNPQNVRAYVRVRLDYEIESQFESPVIKHTFSRYVEINTVVGAASIYSKRINSINMLFNKEGLIAKAIIEEAYLTDGNYNYKSSSVVNLDEKIIGASGIHFRENALLPIKLVKYKHPDNEYMSLFKLANPNINNMSARIVIRSKDGQNNIVVASDWYPIGKYSIPYDEWPLFTLEPNPLIKGGEKYYIEVEAKETVSGVVTNAPVERTEYTMHSQVEAVKPTITDISFNTGSRKLTFKINNLNNFTLYSLNVKVRVGDAIFSDTKNIYPNSSSDYEFNLTGLTGTAEITADKFTFDSPSNTMPYTKEIQTGLGITYYAITSTQEKTATPTIVSHTCKIKTRLEGSLYVQYKLITVGVKNNDNSSVTVYLNDVAKGVLAGKSTNSFSISIDDIYVDDTVNVTVQAPNKSESDIVSIKPTNCTEEPPLVEV